MKLKMIIALNMLLTAFHSVIYSQSTISGPGVGNTRPAFAAFVGWNGFGPNPGDLQIRNNFVGQRINIFTNGIRRITIMDGGTAAADGFVGTAS